MAPNPPLPYIAQKTLAPHEAQLDLDRWNPFSRDEVQAPQVPCQVRRL